MKRFLSLLLPALILFALCLPSCDGAGPSGDGTSDKFNETEPDPTMTTDCSGGTNTAEAVTTAETDKREKYALFIIAGQSNAQGGYDAADVDAGSSAAEATPVDPGVGVYIDARTVAEAKASVAVDLSNGRTGFACALARRWNELTGEKVIIIVGASNGAPMAAWLPGGDYAGSSAVGNCYDNTLTAYRNVMSVYGADPGISIVRTGMFWCHGETEMNNEWRNGTWVSANPDLLTADRYVEMFTEMYRSMERDMKVEFGAINLVRTNPNRISQLSRETGIYTDLVPIRAAQYALHNSSELSNVFIASRISDIAVSVSRTDLSDRPGYGYMGTINVHYRQQGYNAVGADLAENTYARICGTPAAPTGLEVLAEDGQTRLSDGDTVKVTCGDGCQIAGFVLPIGSRDTGVSYEVTAGSEYYSVDRNGFISTSADARPGSAGEIVVRAESGHSVTLKLIGQDALGNTEEKTYSQTVWRWDFDGNIAEMNQYNNLTDTAESTLSYSFGEGRVFLADANTDFTLAVPFTLSSERDWALEWKAEMTQVGTLFGNEISSYDFIYLAYTVDLWDKPFRLVPTAGSAMMIPYGDYAQKNTEMNSWRVEYESETGTMTLFFLGSGGWEKVGSTVTGQFSAHFTRMFGRYSRNNFGMRGSVDYVQVELY